MQYLSNLTSKHLQSGKFLTHLSKILFANMVGDFCIAIDNWAGPENETNHYLCSTRTIQLVAILSIYIERDFPILFIFELKPVQWM